MLGSELDRRSLRSWTAQTARTTLIGLLVVLVPVVVVWKSLQHAHKLVSHGLAKMAPGVEFVGGVAAAFAILLAILIVCWCMGWLVLRTALGRQVREWEKAKFTSRSPFLKKYVKKFSGETPDTPTSEQPALAHVTGDWQPAVIVEEHENGWATVFVPAIPAVATGRLYCLPAEQILRLEMPLDEFKQKLTKSGRGSQDWLQTVASASSSPRPRPTS